MNIKRVLNLGEAETDTLVNAGRLLGEINNAKADFDELGPETTELLIALKTVLNKLIAE